MVDGMAFGWRTALLSAALVQLLILALALFRPLANRIANRTLATLLMVLTGLFMPWLIGFAGFYDKWPWLTFLPLQISLAVAPLGWLYVHALVYAKWPPRGWWHMAPALGQFLFLFASFLLPSPAKFRWAEAIDPAYDVLTTVATLAGLLLYGGAGLRLLQRYRAWLATQRADDDRYAARWLVQVLGVTLALVPLIGGFAVANAITPLGYTGYMGLYTAVAAIALYMGVEGWRHAHRPFPVMGELGSATESESARDWRAIGEAWAEAVLAQQWHRDPDLTLASLARRLGTNSSYLSRGLNEGLGVNFSQFINALRSDTVAEMIRAGHNGSLLDLALEAGFSSKASFNRAFLSATGMTPSAYRAQVATSQKANIASHSGIEPTAGERVG